MPSGNELKSNCPLLNLSLAKIRELHGGFKSICDNFAINLTEFESIFQSNQATFSIFDTDNNGLIDALEIFSGLIIFAEAKAEDKIRFLFDLFDFNEIQSISLLDLEFMIQSVLISTSKIFNLGQDISDLEIVQLVRRNFQEGQRLQLPQLLVWCSKTEEIQQYFIKLRMDGPQMISQKVLQDSEFVVYEKHAGEGLDYKFPPGHEPMGVPEQKQAFISKSASELVQNKRAQNFRAWLHTALQPIVSYRLESITMNNYLRQSDEVKVQLEWVYGIRCQDTKRTLQYTVGSMYSDSIGTRNKYEQNMLRYNEEIIYFVSNTVVLLNIHINKQRFYSEHKQEIISLAVSNLNGDFIATGEYSLINPTVHVWNCRTLENISVLEGVHQRGIHLLAFSADDRFLITCGLLNPSAVIIYDWAISTVIVSSSINSPTQDIVILKGHATADQMLQSKTGEVFSKEEQIKMLMGKKDELKLVEGFVLLSLEMMVVFVYDRKLNEFKLSYVSMDQASDYTKSLPLCCLSILADYKNQYFKNKEMGDDGAGINQIDQDDVAILDMDHTLKHIVLTGHRDGKILIWRLQNFVGVLDDYGCQVTCMSKCYEGICFGTMQGQIYIWDTYLLKCHKVVDINQLPFKILSNFIVSLDSNQRRLLLLTMYGDVIEVALNDSWSKQSIKAQRINTIVRITSRQNKALTILNQAEQTLLVGGDNGVVSSYDIATHELIDVWNVGQPVSSLACLSLDEGGFVVAAGTDSGKIVIRQDWEEFIPRQHECGTKTIIDLKFSKNGQLIAAASLDKYIYLLKYYEGDYTALAACKLENGFPVSLNFSEDSSKIVINTNQRKLLVLDPKNFELLYKPEDISSCFWSSWISKFSLITKSTTSIMLPIVLGNVSNLVVAGDENGNIQVWKDVENIKEHIGSNYQTHTSNVQKLELTINDRRLISLGQTDNCICQFKIKALYYEENAVSIQRGHSEVPSQVQTSQKVIIDPQQDECSILELNYCCEIQNRKTDQINDKTCLIRGARNTSVNRILARANFDNEEKNWIRPPSISLVLDHIYGCLISDKRHTIMYLHFYNKLDQEVKDRIKLKDSISVSKQLNLGEGAEKKLDLVLPRILGTDYQTLLKQQQHIEYDPIHATCLKHLVYVVSRYGVVYDATKRKQNFYQGHKLKVSAIARHPYLRVVATGEVNIYPTIHVWDAQTMETLVVLYTAHRGGILHLVFSPDGQKIISIGMDRTFSIQAFNWRQGRSLVYRNTGYYPVFGIKFNPYDDSSFITCGYQHLCEWKLVGSHLTIQKFINAYNTHPVVDEKNTNFIGADDQPFDLGNKKNILLCMDFLSYRLGHSIQSDVILGNNLGDISTYCSQKYFILNEQAHPRNPINCIKVTNTLSYDLKTVMIITSSEDGFIKIWDASIQLKQQIDVKQACSVLDLKNIKSYGIASIDVYACDKQSTKSTASIRILVAVRAGDIIEICVDFNKDYLTTDDVVKNKDMNEEQKALALQKIQYQNDMNQKYNIEFQELMGGHSSLHISHKAKKILTCLYPLYSILASVGNDETLCFWDIGKNECFLEKNLGTQATCLDFSPDGKFMCIGLVNGVFLLLDSYLERKNYGTYMEEYTVPTLGVIMCPKDSKSSIVSLKFSYDGSFIALSYNNEYRMQDILEDAENEDLDNPLSHLTTALERKNQVGRSQEGGKRDMSFVLIYVNKLSEKNPGVQLTSKDPYVKMQKIQIPLNELQTSVSLQQKLAVTKLDFSDDDRYIEMCSQAIDKDNNLRAEHSEDIIVVWDIQQNRIQHDYDKLKNVTWPDWSLSSTINARYIDKYFNRQSDDEEKKKFMNETCQMTVVSRFQLLDNAVMGSIFGEIFAFRFPCMYIDKNKILEFQYERVAKRQMSISKAFDALTSSILSINIFEDKKVFVTGNSDGCILQYRVDYEDQDWELDFNNFLQDLPDPFGEIPHYSKFMSLISETWSHRLNLLEIQQNIDMEEYKNPTCELELEHLIGRRAYDRRNNLKIDCQDRIVYSVGSLIVYLQDNLDPEADSFINQTFLRPNSEKFQSIAPEVSCFTLSEDRRMLYIGLNQIEASLIIWEISTNLCLAKISLPQISIVYSLKVAYDNKHVLIVGITPEFISTIILMEYTTQTVICQKNFLHSLPYKIKDIGFIPGYTRRFVTCGIQHMNFWKFNGQNLEFTVGELTIPKAFSNIGSGVYNQDKNQLGKFGLNLVCQEAEMINTVMRNQMDKKGAGINKLDDELENIFVTFLCLGFINDTLITTGDDGYLYIWEHERIIRRVFGHEGAIFALDCNQKLGFICSGGMEGIVLLWRLLVEPRSNIKSLDKLKVFNLRRNLDSQQAVMNSEYNVQSVFISYNRIVVGMRSGSILEMQISDDGSSVIRAQQDRRSKVRKWMKCIDHEVPISVAVDMISSRVFTITAAGLFTVFDILTFDVIFQRDFHKIALNIIAFKLANKVLLVFENDIIVVDANSNNGYDELKEYELKLNKVSDAKLNSNEKLLGVASTSASTPEVSLYEVNEGFAKLTTFYGFKASIKYIDFSTDNYYLQCEDNLGEVQLFEIESSRLINTDAIDFDLEWLGEGLRTYSAIENVRKQYSADNKILSIVKLPGKSIIAIGDEVGTVRFYNYPNNGRDGYFQVYVDHLYGINKCLFTQDQKYFITVSPADRSVYKWKTSYNDAKIRDLMSLLIK